MPTKREDYPKLKNLKAQLEGVWEKHSETSAALGKAADKVEALTEEIDEAGVDQYLGSTTPKDIAALRSKLEQAEAEYRTLDEEHDRQSRAIDILQERIEEARAEAQNAIRPEWWAEHTKRAEAVFETLKAAEQELAELAAFEQESERQGVTLARIGRSGIVQGSDRAGGRLTVEQWIHHLEKHHNYMTRDLKAA